jgi:hypothetical protein
MTPVQNEQTASQANLVASVITESSTPSVPAYPLHVERLHLVDGSPIKATEFSQPEWGIQLPIDSVIDPSADLSNIRARLMREGSDADKLLSLRQH